MVRVLEWVLGMMVGWLDVLVRFEWMDVLVRFEWMDVLGVKGCLDVLESVVELILVKMR